MRNPFLPLALLFTLFIGPGCVKDTDCTPKSPASEAAAMQNYANMNGMAVTAHSSGLYYQVLNPGSGATATTNSTIFITYTGKLLDGSTFDSQSNSALTGWRLSDLIEGWKVGIPLIKEGGHIQLLVPSAMAYGCTGYGAIPGNSILFFDITLVDVQ